MNTAARERVRGSAEVVRRGRSNGDRAANEGVEKEAAGGRSEPQSGPKPRVLVAAENRLLVESLSRMLAKNGDIDVVCGDAGEPFRPEILLREKADILLMISSGSVDKDLLEVRKVRAEAANVQILLIGVAGGEPEFLQCVRAGVRGYLPREASAEDILEGVRAVQAGEAVCPGRLCGALFHYFEREATAFPSARVHQRLGLTRREQQLIPLIAEGLTNKEIANRFCLSEQTVKNHLYRMKHKIGAGGRMEIVQVCRTQGFMI